MGLLDWLLGRKKTAEPARKPSRRPPAPRDGGEGSGFVVDSLEGESFPLTAEFRLRSKDYDRLKQKWQRVTVPSLKDWEAKKSELEQDFFRRFAFYKTRKGQVVSRWNREVWEFMRTTLIVERRR